MKEYKLNSFNIFDRCNPDFKLLFNTCDSYFRELREEGIGQNLLNLILGMTKRDCGQLECFLPQMPKGLLNAVFFLNGKNFALRGGSEHRCLKISQISRKISPEGKARYTYTENCSKNRAGGFNQLSVPNKVVHQYQDLEAGERFHLYVLDEYLSNLPPNAIDQDIFYLRPTNESNPWYMSVPIGKNPLSKMMKTTYEEAGISGNKTIHSLRAYSSSELFTAGVPEKDILDRTGHRSLDGLRK